MKTPKALAISSQRKERRRRWPTPAQGWSIATTLGTYLHLQPTLKGFANCLTLSGFRRFFFGLIPGLSLRSNPGLKLANAFGVISNCITSN
jgi:hypothetical protein